MKTYPEMNAKIVDLLRMSENPRCLYAAARIEELEKKIAATRPCTSRVRPWEARMTGRRGWSRR